MSPREYVTRQLSIICGVPVAPTEEQVTRWWAALTREEERRAAPDQHGNFPHAGSTLAQLGLLESPFLHDDIAALCAQHGETPARWPNGRRFAACLTHDVDRIVQRPWRERVRLIARLYKRTHPLRLLRWSFSAAVYGAQALLGATNLAPYDFWLEEEGRHGFHSTFFVLPEQLEQPTPHDHYYRYRDIVQLLSESMTFTAATRRVRELGWEIGLHGSYGSAFNTGILRGEKERLEGMLGEPVSSVRQHFLRFNIDVTPQVQADAGFTTDTTLGYSATIGCRAGLAFPYFWPAAGDLLEVPLIIQDVGLLRNSENGGELAGALARARALIERIADAGGVVTLSWHTHPDSPGAHACYRALLEMIAELGGWGCSLGELNAWWRQRRAAVLESATEVGS